MGTIQFIFIKTLFTINKKSIDPLCLDSYTRKNFSDLVIAHIVIEQQNLGHNI